MMKQTGKVFAALGVALMFVLHVNADNVCPGTVSQGGTNTTSASFMLHDSVGGIGGVSQTSASFQSDVGYIPQILSGCNCLPCDEFVSQACDALQLNQQTTFASALAFLEALLADSDPPSTFVGMAVQVRGSRKPVPHLSCRIFSHNGKSETRNPKSVPRGQNQ